MSFKGGVISLIILLSVTVSGSLGETLRVTWHPQTVCALRESTVKLECSYSYTIQPQQIFWFSPKQRAKWRNEGDPEGVALDLDYAGRVSYGETRSYGYRYAILTIRDLRERDSGHYHIMIISETGERYSSSTAVSLRVSDLQLRMTSYSVKQVELTCNTSCRLTTKPGYYSWLQNGQRTSWTYEHQRVLSAGPGSYSCSVNIPDQIYSNTVCVLDENCWSVSYSDRRVCALEGSSVDFPCTYSYPSDQTVNEAFWNYIGSDVEPTDLSMDEQFAGRVEFFGDKEKNCGLRMRNLTKRDSGQYHFRFITDNPESFSGRPGVILSVTDLQVKASPTTPSKGHTVTLTCISTCTLPNNPTFVWYKNGQRVTNKPTTYNKLYLESASPEDLLQYSCALGGPASARLTFVTVGVAVFLVVLLIVGWMWIRRRKISLHKGHKSSEESRQHDVAAAIYSNILNLAMTSDLTPREGSDNEDGIHYSSVQFKHSIKYGEAPPSTCTLHVTEDHDVQYAAVNFQRPSEVNEDSSQTYSQIQKRK